MEEVVSVPKYKKEYYNDFSMNHDTKKVEICPICLGKVSYYSKSKHNKTKKHQLALTKDRDNKEKENTLLELHNKLTKLQEKIDMLSKI